MLRALLFTLFQLMILIIQGQSWMDLRKEINTNIENKNYPKVLSIASAALSQAEKEYGKEHYNYALALKDLGDGYYYNYKDTEAEENYIKYKDLVRQLSGTKNEKYIHPLAILGAYYLEMNLLAKAEASYLEILEIYNATSQKIPKEISGHIYNLALVYLNQYELKKAEDHLLLNLTKLGESQELYLKTLIALLELYTYQKDIVKTESIHFQMIDNIKKNKGETHIDYFVAQNNLAVFYMNTAQYAKAEKLLLDLLDEKKKKYGELNESYITTLANLAIFYKKISNYSKAEPLYSKVIELKIKLSGENDPSLAIHLYNSAQFYLSIRNYEVAKTLFSQAIAIQRKSNDIIGLPQSLSKLALLNLHTGNLSESEMLFLEVEKIYKNSNALNQSGYAAFLLDFGEFYKTTGDYIKSLELIVQAVNIEKKKKGTDHPDLAHALFELGSLFSTVKFNKEAKERYDEVIRIYKLNNLTDHPDYAAALNNLASVSAEIGDYERSEELLEEALDLTIKKYGKDHPDYAIQLQNTAGVLTMSKQYKKAEPLFEEALQILVREYGKNHYYYYNLINNIGFLNEQLGNFNKMDSMYTLAYSYLENQIDRNFLFMSENEKINFITKITGEFDYRYSVYLRLTNNIEKAGIIPYNMALTSKEISLKATNRMKNIVMSSNDPEINKLFDDWTNTKRSLANAYSKSNTEKETILELEQKTTELEKKLVRASRELSKEISQKRNDWQAVQASLKPNEAAIEFISFRYRSSVGWTDSVIYAAIVLKKDSEFPVMIPLFEKQDLIQALQKKTNSSRAYINQLYGTRDNFFASSIETNNELYNLIWSPIEDKLANTEIIYFTPSGLLHNIAFAAIRMNDSILLSDKYDLRQMSTTANIVDVRHNNFQPNSITLFGGIYYDTDKSTLVQESIKYKYNKTNNTRSLPDSLRGNTWEYLPGTLAETEFIASLAADKKIKNDLFIGNKAIEEAFKNLDGEKSPSILHISTHGFFFPDPTSDMDTTQENIYQYSKNPLMRSGLLFAGANNTWKNSSAEGIEDGILTSFEVSNIHLPNTHLVILSACETGLGDINGSEGVFGLQRSFKMAGVPFLIMSLWQVPDKATAQFMSYFYHEWFNGKQITDAFKYAQHQMRKHYPTEPMSWAAFVLVN